MKIGPQDKILPHAVLQLLQGSRSLRNWPYNFLVTSVWADPADSDANIRWTREFVDAMQPFLADAAYVNYLGKEGEDRIRSAYGARKHDRLAALKKKYDPANLFCLNQNIKPAA